MEDIVSQKIIRNTVFNLLGRAWGLLVILALTPFIIAHLGVERFGIWMIVEALISQFGLLDFGFSTSFIKYIAEYFAKEDFKKINEVINTGFIFYSICAILAVVAGF